jgi:hypothetical protein
MDKGGMSNTQGKASRPRLRRQGTACPESDDETIGVKLQDPAAGTVFRAAIVVEKRA